MKDTEQNITDRKTFIRNRITELRMNANISEYQMSLELGQNRSYIQSISSGKALPSMSGFLNICDYFNITPADFFREDMKNPELINAIGHKLQNFSENDLKLIDKVLSRIIEIKDG